MWIKLKLYSQTRSQVGYAREGIALPEPDTYHTMGTVLHTMGTVLVDRSYVLFFEKSFYLTRTSSPYNSTSNYSGKPGNLPHR